LLLVAVFWLTHGGFAVVKEQVNERMSDTINELAGWFR